MGKGVAVAPTANVRYAVIDSGGRNSIGDYSKVSGELSLGYATTIGRANHIFGKVTIGRYCQLAPCVGIYAMNHPLTHVTTYVNSQLFGGRLKTWQRADTVVIGNDVWLGHGAVVLPGVTIGNGAVIGAGAVVTRPIPAFAVALGAPARVTRSRFPESIVEALSELKWWDRTVEEMSDLEELFQMDLCADADRALAWIAEYVQHDKLIAATDGRR